MASAGSWSAIEAPCQCSQEQQPTPQEPIDESKMIRVYVGRSLQIFLMPEELFHHYIHGYAQEFQRRSYFGIEKNLGLPDENPDIFATFVEWANGKKNVYKEHPIGSPVHELTCFKLYILAYKLGIQPLVAETWQEIGKSLRSGRYQLSKEAVALAFKITKGVNLEELREGLVFWTMKRFFLNGYFRKGSSWKKAMSSNETFDKEVAIAIGYHILRTVDDCGLEHCYVHQQEDPLKMNSEGMVMSDGDEVGGRS